MTGSLPAGQMDHINGNRSDDRWVNLRDVPQSMNMHNQRAAQKTSKSGLLGAFYWKRCGRWTARIRRQGIDYHIGLFDTKEEAHQAYLAKKREIHEGYVPSPQPPLTDGATCAAQGLLL